MVIKVGEAVREAAGSNITGSTITGGCAGGVGTIGVGIKIGIGVGVGVGVEVGAIGTVGVTIEIGAILRTSSFFSDVSIVRTNASLNEGVAFSRFCFRISSCPEVICLAV